MFRSKLIMKTASSEGTFPGTSPRLPSFIDHSRGDLELMVYWNLPLVPDISAWTFAYKQVSWYLDCSKNFQQKRMFLSWDVEFSKSVHMWQWPKKDPVFQDLISRERNILFCWKCCDSLRTMGPVYRQYFRSKFHRLSFPEILDTRSKIQ